MTVFRSTRAGSGERDRPLTGDAFIEAPAGALTNAITIRRPREAVWPWLVQMGAGTRAGWYSYDWLDNGGRPSARRIIPSMQDIDVGTLFPALPGATDGFTVLNFQTNRFLVLEWRPAGSADPIVTWAFVLEARPGGATRLIVRARAGQEYSFRALPKWIGLPLARLVHAIMQRRQLLGIAARAEGRGPAILPPSGSKVA